jgi:hypothetical protein
MRPSLGKVMARGIPVFDTQSPPYFGVFLFYAFYWRVNLAENLA